MGIIRTVVYVGIIGGIFAYNSSTHLRSSHILLQTPELSSTGHPGIQLPSEPILGSRQQGSTNLNGSG